MKRIYDEPQGALDRENVFMLYATFCGDIVRTAHASGISETAILKMSEDEGWQSKLGPILALKKSTKPGDVERAINRALCFVQAHKMRMFVGRVIKSLTDLTPEQFNDYIYPESTSKDGSVERKITTRAIADLASAMEKAQALTYLALSDTSTDRGRRKENPEAEDDLSAADLHARIAAATSEVAQSNSPRAQLFDAQLVQAAEIVEQSQHPPNPLNDDNH